MPMREPMLQLYLHVVWGTWDRLPYLTPEVKAAVYACIQKECAALKVRLVAIGGTRDHVHLLVELPATISVASFLKQVKGSSSHLASHCGPGSTEFRWQGAYGAFTVGKKDLHALIGYIENQERHHADGTIIPEAEIPIEERAPHTADVSP